MEIDNVSFNYSEGYVKTSKQYALKGQKYIAQGGYWAFSPRYLSLTHPPPTICIVISSETSISNTIT